ncbi:YfaZ family outer membrane protein [Marinobacteraceae bacterium S3BR75-40.1]
MKARILPALLIAGLATSAAAEDVALSLTDDSAKAQFNTSVNRGELALGGGYTYHEGSRHILNLDVHAQGRTALGNLPATAGIGLRTIAFDDDNVNGGAIGLGGFGKINIPDVPGLSVNGSLHYAPSILSFDDADDMKNIELSLSYRVIRNAEVFGGYRFMDVDLDPGKDLTLDEGGMVGIRMFF